MVHYFATKSGKTLMNTLFSVGAGIVIIGALGKINHTSWGGMALTVGMLTECILFFIMVLVPVPHEHFWERYFPEILNDPSDDIKNGKSLTQQKINFALPGSGGGGGSDANPALVKLDTMLQNAGISPQSLTKLSDNFEKLNKTVSNLNDISSSVGHLSEFSNKTKETNSALDDLKNAYIQTAGKITNDKIGEGVNHYLNELQKLTKNLNSLNSIYSIDGKDSGMANMKSYFSDLNSYAKEVHKAAESMEETQKEIDKLTSNLSNLNGIYGKMLTAMQNR